jgi:hypothetical protein
MVSALLSPPGVNTYANYSNVAAAAFPYGDHYGGNEYLAIFVSSHFQSGRTKWSFIPNNTYNIAEFNTMYSVLVDLSNNEANAIGTCVSVGWGQSKPYLKLRDQAINVVGASPPYDADFDNGQLVLEVVNPLVGPDGAQTIDVLFFHRGGKDLTFAAPIKPEWGSNVLTPYAQSGEMERAFDDVQAFELVPSNPNFDEKALISFGEATKSARNLIKRYEYWHTKEDHITTANTKLLVGRVMSGLPVFPGKPSKGGLGIDVSSTGYYNYTTPTPLMWFTMCHSGRRGSLRLKVIPTGVNITISTMTAGCRDDITGYFYTVDITKSDVTYKRMISEGISTSYGNSTALASVNPALEIDVPMRTGRKFGRVVADSGYEQIELATG